MRLSKCEQTVQQQPSGPSETRHILKSHGLSPVSTARTNNLRTGDVKRQGLRTYAACSQTSAAVDHQQLTPWGPLLTSTSRSCSRDLDRRQRTCNVVRSGAGSNGSRCPVLILPGFLSNNTTSEQSQYRELANNLLTLGHPAAEILPVTTWDWLPTLSGGSFKWYIQRLAEAVRQLADKYDSQVCLVGISAGGWLARIALGSVPYHGVVWGLAPLVHTLVTCGTPHQSMEAYPFGRAEEAWLCDLPEDIPSAITTSLQYANHFYPDADSLKPSNIVCVVGSAATGESFSMSQVGLQVITGQLPIATANDKWFVQSSYVANCGEAAVDGDGVCPVKTGTVPGATTLVLPGVWHNQEPNKLWYGSMEVVQEWDKYLP